MSVLANGNQTSASLDGCCAVPPEFNSNARINDDHIALKFTASVTSAPTSPGAFLGDAVANTATGQYWVWNGSPAGWMAYPAKTGVLALGTNNAVILNTGSSWVSAGNSNASVADLLRASTSSGNVVTDAVLRAALNGSLDFRIETSSAAANVNTAYFKNTGTSSNALAVQKQGGTGFSFYADSSVPSNTEVAKIYSFGTHNRAALVVESIRSAASTDATSTLEVTRSGTAFGWAAGIQNFSSGNGLFVTGNIQATGTITPSDERLKEDLEEIKPAEAYKAVMSVRLFKGRYRDFMGREDLVEAFWKEQEFKRLAECEQCEKDLAEADKKEAKTIRAKLKELSVETPRPKWHQKNRMQLFFIAQQIRDAAKESPLLDLCWQEGDDGFLTVDQSGLAILTMAAIQFMGNK